ncbi:putative thiazole-containing bacteriocin maturation protein [Chlamydia abortus]|uniref:Thiazole-containing bacteriocin maturation protein n=1 Tax=Paenibacillus residui TaxID=629724 RepID=A0ABW3D6X5_9BACL|nr:MULTISPECIES: putative thiazole-containing bacteriocin maturation protein [Paenibacillaceae]SHE10889.1 putative thiazole-containing bacteriocin maturation protein [Chlamydia abortus]
MPVLNPSMRLKVNRDTFYLPESDGGVYFRNNMVSFRMEGRAIRQWIEMLIPMFSGEYTLAELTDGLQDAHRDQVYEIARVLLQNGFIRDLSEDRPHQLPDEVLDKYASQIEFLDSLGGSGGYRFQSFRQSNVLAVGCGPLLVSLAAALLESGLPGFRLLVTDSVPTDRRRLEELVEHARKWDSSVAVEEVSLKRKGAQGWRELVRTFDAVLYVSQNGGEGELRLLHAVCKEEKKVLLPAIILQQTGMAGPLIHPETDGCWESAIRRIHRPALCKEEPQHHLFSIPAGAMLANVIVFEWLKTAAGISEAKLNKHLFLLDLETLEGDYYPFLPHPQVTGYAGAEWIHDVEARLERGAAKDRAGSGTSGLFAYFTRITSDKAGILRIWDEGDLIQLPLSQCRVQAADPQSEGPAELLPEIICSGLTHEEARREAGLAGLEAYTARMAAPFLETLYLHRREGMNMEAPELVLGVGAGETPTAGISRGLQACLREMLRSRTANGPTTVYPIQWNGTEDGRSRYYYQALTTMQGEPEIALGEGLSGFPVVWVGSGGHWYGGVGLNRTMALRLALQQALMTVQNDGKLPSGQILEAASVRKGDRILQWTEFPAVDSEEEGMLLNALRTLKEHERPLLVCDLALEPFLKEGPTGVFGVLLRKEESL